MEQDGAPVTRNKTNAKKKKNEPLEGSRRPAAIGLIAGRWRILIRSDTPSILAGSINRPMGGSEGENQIEAKIHEPQNGAIWRLVWQWAPIYGLRRWLCVRPISSNEFIYPLISSFVGKFPSDRILSAAKIESDEKFHGKTSVTCRRWRIVSSSKRRDHRPRHKRPVAG